MDYDNGHSTNKIGQDALNINGTYHWRVAVNDADGLGILAEAVPVCEIRIKDDFRAVGVVEIEHTWSQEGANWNA